MLLIAGKSSASIKETIAVISILALLVLPIYWTAITITKTGNESTPTAGPTSGMGGPGGGGGMRSFDGNMEQGFIPSEMAPGNMPSDSGAAPSSAGENDESTGFAGRTGGGGDMESIDSGLMSYLEENYNGEKFFLAVQRAQSAYSIMLNTDYAVMAMGGFGGSDPAPTVQELEEMAEAGEIKYFLVSGQGMGGNSEVTEWIQENCVEVPSSEYSSDSSTSTDSTASAAFDRGMGQTLYEYQQ